MSAELVGGSMTELRELTKTATDAANALARHEAICAERWSEVQKQFTRLEAMLERLHGYTFKIGLLTIMGLFGVCGFLFTKAY